MRTFLGAACRRTILGDVDRVGWSEAKNAGGRARSIDPPGAPGSVSPLGGGGHEKYGLTAEVRWSVPETGTR